jgi:uncharacterized protein with PhoU and TrkA domain
VASIAVGKHTLIVAQTHIEPGSPADAGTIGDLEASADGRVLLIESQAGKEWAPAPERTLAPGDVMTVVATRKGLIQLLESTEGLGVELPATNQR